MSNESNRCQGLTKSGRQCKRNAQEGSDYCYTHRNTIAQEETPPSPPPTPEPTAEAAAKTSAQTGRIAEIAEIQAVLQELNVMVDDLRQRVPDFTPPPFSSEALLDWLRKNFDRFAPQLFKDIGENLEDATVEDFKDPDTWRGIWFLITYSVKQESEELFEKLAQQAAENPTVKRGKDYFEGLPTVREGRQKIESIPAVKQTKEFIEGLPGVKEGRKLLSSLPGANVVSSFAEAIDDATPKDFLDADTWSGIWYVVNHSLEAEWEDLKKRVSDDDHGEEDEIIDVS